MLYPALCVSKKVKILHGDIKTDNILLKGINNKDKKLIELYKNKNFIEKYQNKKIEFWLNKGEEIKNISRMKQNDSDYIRRKIHFNICADITKEFNNNYNDSIKYLFDDKYLKNPEICIADFGDYCDEDEKFDEEFGTRYYRAPEIILLSECDNKVDVWAAGCCLYELLTGKILFDPKKDKERTRDFFHLLNIFQLSGKFPKRFLKNTKYWRNFFNKNGQFKNLKKNDNIMRINWIEKLKIDDPNIDHLINLLESIFTINPKNRINTDNILKHKWLNC